MKDAVIIADDLTGACDTGIKLAARGHEVEVVLDARFLPEKPLHGGGISYTINTNTRSAETDEAYRTVYRVTSAMNAMQPCLLYKKIDSVLRGNLVVEIDAVLDAAGLETALIAPALPQSGRVVRNGVLYVDTPSAKPFSQDVAAALFGTAPRQDCAHISLQEVQAGSESLREKISRVQKQRYRYCIVDAQTREELSCIARALEALEGILPVGSAGLAEQMFATMPTDAAERGVTCRSMEKDTLGLLVVASKHPLAIAQLGRLRERKDTAFFTFSTQALKRETPEQIATRLARHILAHYEAQNATRVYVITTEENMLGICEGRSGFSGEDLSDDGIVTAATQAAAVAVRKLPFTAVIASGGDTASGFLSHFSQSHVQLLEEPLPGAVAAKMTTAGEAARLLLTKSGGFGETDVLNKLTDYMLTHRVAQPDER